MDQVARHILKFDAVHGDTAHRARTRGYPIERHALRKGEDALAIEGIAMHKDDGGLDGASVGTAASATKYPVLVGGLSSCSSSNTTTGGYRAVYPG